jgi:hypothetical protein
MYRIDGRVTGLIVVSPAQTTVARGRSVVFRSASPPGVIVPALLGLGTDVVLASSTSGIHNCN